MSLVRWRMAAAPAVRRHYDTSEPARWRAGATPAARHPATTRCRLKVFSQATTRGPYGGTTSAQGFLSRCSWSRLMWLGKDVCRLLPRLAQALLGAAADRHRPPPQGAGALCQHQGGAGERPPFSTLRARPNKHPSFCCARVSSWLQHIKAAIGLASAGSWQRQGHSHSKPKNLFP